MPVETFNSWRGRMKPEQILNIADKNGFDWFGITKNIVLPIDADFIGTFICIFSFNNGAQVIPTKYYSLADLATNISYLKAIAKDKWLLLQKELIEDITLNNSSGFWAISTKHCK